MAASTATTPRPACTVAPLSPRGWPHPPAPLAAARENYYRRSALIFFGARVVATKWGNYQWFTLFGNVGICSVMESLSDLKLSRARLKRLANAAKRFTDLCLEDGLSLARVCQLVIEIASQSDQSGGTRAGAGRKPRNWPAAMGSKDDAGEIAGPDLFGIGLRVAVERALFPHLSSDKKAFAHIMSRKGVGGHGELRPTWEAYQHALKNPPKGAREAADHRRRTASQLRCQIDPITNRELKNRPTFE